MNDSPEEIREKLSKFSAQLKKLTFPTSPISVDLAKFVSTSLDRYLDGDASTLDAAFSLKPKRGSPGDPAKRRAMAKKILELRLGGKSWNEVSEALTSGDAAPLDEREIRRTYKEFKVQVMAEEVGRRLNFSDPD